MPRFSVDPATLRATASTVDAVVEGSTGEGEIAHPSGVGHSGLSAAVSTFIANIGDSWRSRTSDTEAIAEGLRNTATTYEAADDDGARIGAGGMF